MQQDSTEVSRIVAAHNLKFMAWACKTVATVEWVAIPLLILHPRWANPVADLEIVGMALLSILPNRWLVCSRTTFMVSLFLTLFPFHIFFDISAFRGLDTASVAAMIIAIFFFAPLPMSLVLSRLRLRRNDEFAYA